MGDIPHFGGSAGDDNYLTHTHVYFGGEFHSGAAVVLLVNTWLDFEVFTTHHILPRGEKLVVTRADSGMRRVYELNAEPAAEEYAQLIGVPVAELNHQIFRRSRTRWLFVSTISTTSGPFNRSIMT